jgi:hypothetical protein
MIILSNQAERFKGASGMIKFLTGSCLSELGIVLKEPTAILFFNETPC